MGQWKFEICVSNNEANLRRRKIGAGRGEEDEGEER